MKTLYEVWVKLDREHSDPTTRRILAHFNRELPGLGIQGRLSHESHPPFKMRLTVGRHLTPEEVELASQIILLAFREAYPGSEPTCSRFQIK